MGTKSYLKDQVRLVCLTKTDLFTDEEIDLYLKMIEAGNQLDRLDEQGAGKEEKLPWLMQKKEYKSKLEKLQKQHEGTPRTVRLASVVYAPKGTDLPQGVSWKNLKFAKKISEFSSEMSRAMGLKDRDYTLDKIVLKWSKSVDILKQVVLNGFYIPILLPNGEIEKRHYSCFTASAGQLRTDKIVCVSDNIWEKIHERLECGLTWDRINEHGGCNPAKLCAYLALSNSATDEWTDFDIDRCIVIDEFEGEVTGRMQYITTNYSIEDGVRTVEIDHTDGCGIMLPSVSDVNFMARGPYIKGLLCVFDVLKFCEEKGVPPVIKDIWGLEHDLVKENIQILFTKSQFKMWKYYSDWNEYKDIFKKCGARFGKMKYEEQYIEHSQTSYQVLQTLTDFTDEEIKEFTRKAHNRIENLTRDKASMLELLHANELSENPYSAALALYPELLREAYTKNQLKDVRKRMLLDAKSGKFKIANKRLYAIPDLYAACEYWFCHIEKPVGLLKDGEVACKIFRRHDKADVLRSPHLYFEHAIRNIVKDDEIYRWFTTNGIYTSCHDLISRILQFDQWSN